MELYEGLQNDGAESCSLSQECEKNENSVWRRVALTVLSGGCSHGGYQ